MYLDIVERFLEGEELGYLRLVRQSSWDTIGRLLHPLIT